ncbi:hypothetical protein CVIRNUC_007250 [Coccomyxa viridis]|uniref:serine--tRNA ligase n=1 Tax=Coccomyxa viridis TaxID=1274662 RepID=A0AAV1ICU8_9CHLO|nr:hypothetical protein CVIRNUC_007250 [Coccomyxa viridis]
MLGARCIHSATSLRSTLQPFRLKYSCHSHWAARASCSPWHQALNSPLNATTPVRQLSAKIVCNAANITSQPASIAARTEEPTFRASIDFQALKSNLSVHVQNVRDRNSDADPEKVVQLYDRWTQMLMEVERLRSERNANAKAMKGKMEAAARAELVAQGRQLKEQLSQLEAILDEAEAELQQEAQKLPNLTHPQAPVGDEDQAVLLRSVGDRPAFSFAPKDHLALGERLGLIDFEAGARVSGAKFVYLCKAAARLEMALCNYAFQKVISKGFMPVCTPDLVRASVLQRCGFQPRAENTQVYSVEGTDMCLTGTAEVPLAGMLLDQIIPEDQLPMRMVAFGHCFRAESGSAGTASKGLYRVHQFSKVEMFIVSTEAQSEGLLSELCQIEEEIFTELGLHYKVLDMPTNDLGAPAYRKIDIEAWMPGMDRYGEISSASNCTDYQARRLNLRYRPVQSATDSPQKKTPTRFAHTLNGTACAVPRMIVAILENFQQEDGSILA